MAMCEVSLMNLIPHLENDFATALQAQLNDNTPNTKRQIICLI